MAQKLILRKTGPEADRIVAAFCERTGLATRAGDEAAIFELEGAPRAVDAQAELDAIDPRWADHVELANA
jgi:hypothetical protein